jgi:glycerol-3-phosphate acyltransferase PlsY
VVLVTALLWTAISFLAGAIPFSFLLGRLLLRTDIRRQSDGNPGAANAWRAGGWLIGLPAVLLDGFKGAIPVGLAHFAASVSGWPLVPLAVAPVLGHAFSPFLRFRGGKAVAVTFGIWLGILLGEGPIMLGIFLTIFYLVQTSDAWAIILTMLAFLAHLLLRGADAVVLTIWGANMLILLWKHRQALHELPRLRPWKFLRRER